MSCFYEILHDCLVSWPFMALNCWTKIDLKIAQILAWLFGFHGDMAVLCMKFCYTYVHNEKIFTAWSFHWYIIYISELDPYAFHLRGIFQKMGTIPPILITSASSDNALCAMWYGS